MKNKHKRRNRQRHQQHRAAAADRAAKPSLLTKQKSWPFPVAPEADDHFENLRNKLGAIAELRGDWAGIPMPLEGNRLVIEPRFPGGERLAEIGWTPPPEDDEFKGVKIRGKFWSWSRRGDVVIFEYPDGKIDWGLQRGVHHFDFDLGTLGCSDVWGLQQEAEAQKTLSTLLSARQMKQYLMTGGFLEKSKRSGVFYMFRRLKPSVAMKEVKGRMKIMACLCMHPIAYYAGTWAGAMCPTDDVIAHLMLMRGDEHAYWRQANQHPAYRPEAGL